ncbi:MAG: DUF1573 domain-containing protein [Planctomycetaceae bacterium]|nr:DUF1573 domain-containing protein [Planctomycetaceae bacterium]
MKKLYLPIFGFLSFTILFFATLLAAGYFYLRTPAQPEPPMLTAEPAVADFGKVGPGFHETKIQLINSSKYPTAIINVTKTCSCTQVTIPKRLIPAGEKIELKCRLDTNGKEGRTGAILAIGYVPQTEKIDVDAAPRYLEVELIAEVEPLQQLPSIITVEQASAQK